MRPQVASFSRYALPQMHVKNMRFMAAPVVESGYSSVRGSPFPGQIRPAPLLVPAIRIVTTPPPAGYPPCFSITPLTSVRVSLMR